MEETKDLEEPKASNETCCNRKADEYLQRLINGNLPNVETRFSYQAKTASETMKIVGDFADEVLNLAEKREITLGEILEVPKAIENKVKNEILANGEKYKRKVSPE